MTRKRSKELPPVPTWKCPHCGFIHTPATLLRVDGENLICHECKKTFPAKKAD